MPRVRPAFSLVELVIVVVIIGIIAAIAIPRISRGARGAGEAALRADLAGLRGVIDRYTAEHGGDWPGADGSAGTLRDQLTQKTDSLGNVGSTPGVHIYGPYLRMGLPPLPVGPNAGAKDVWMRTTANFHVDETHQDDGWVYNYETGEIIANTDDLDESGVGYDSY